MSIAAGILRCVLMGEWKNGVPGSSSSNTTMAAARACERGNNKDCTVR